jgi:hypothetical protein
MTCSPRPVSAVKSGSFGVGVAGLGSATAHKTHGPGSSRPNRMAEGWPSPRSASACRSALVSSSDITIAMSLHRCAASHRCSVATVKSRAAWTDLAPALAVRVATRGRHVPSRAGGPGASGQFPLAMAAISTAGIIQRQPLPLAATLDNGTGGGAGITVRSVLSATSGRPSRVHPCGCTCIVQWLQQPRVWHGAHARAFDLLRCTCTQCGKWWAAATPSSHHLGERYE